MSADQYLIDMQTTGQEEIDWNVLTLDHVDEDIFLCAQRLAARYDNITDEDDLVQEGRIWAAENPSQVRGYVKAGHRGQFRNRLASRLSSKIASEARVQGKQIPLARLYENDEE